MWVEVEVPPSPVGVWRGTFLGWLINYTPSVSGNWFQDPQGILYIYIYAYVCVCVYIYTHTHGVEFAYNLHISSQTL